MRPWFGTTALLLSGLALAASDGVPRHVLRPFLGRLQSVPAALVERRPHLLADRVKLVGVDWKRMGAEIAPGLPAEDRARIEGAVARLGGQHGLEAARTALDTHRILTHYLPAGHERAAARTDRDLLETWIAAEEGRWQAMPEVEAGFAEVLRDGDASRAKLTGLVCENLKKLDAALRARDKGRVQLQVALLRRLLEELELR